MDKHLTQRERQGGRTMKQRKTCELCRGEAALHCQSDSAFLCWDCDARVHGANFLVARHARRLLCPECGTFDADHRPVYGPGFLPVLAPCRSCQGGTQRDDGDDGGSSETSACSSSSLLSSLSSSCVSSAESGPAACAGEGGVAITAVPADGDGPLKAGCFINSGTESDCSDPGRRRRRRRRSGRTAARGELDARAGVVLASWCRRLGLEGGCALGAASYALAVSMRRMPAAPFRVCVSAAVWFAAKLCCGDGTGGGRRRAALLRRLEACSGVPAKLIVTAEARLSRAVRRCHVDQKGEGWAECS